MVEVVTNEAIPEVEAPVSTETPPPDVIEEPAQTEEVSTELGADVEPEIEEVKEEVAPVVADEKTPASVNKRLNKMYAEKRAAEEKATHEARRSYELEQELARARTQQAPQGASNYDPYAPQPPNAKSEIYAADSQAYIRDCVRYERDMLVYDSHKAQARQQQARFAEEQARIANEHKKRIESAHERYADYEEKIAGLDSINVSPDSPTFAMLSSTLIGMDNSADILYYLSTNLDECQEMLQKNPYHAAAHLGKISAKLEAPITRKVANAPPPLRKIKGQGSTSVPRSWDTISVDDLAKRLRRPY